MLTALIGRWRAAHGGRLPATYEEKEAFKASVPAAARKLREPELNFEEAHREAYRAYMPPALADDVREILDDLPPPPGGGAAGAAAGGGGGVSNFAVLCAALKAFIAAEGGGLPPLAGVIPDMHADTDKCEPQP